MTELIGFREDITTALVNLFANAIHWLEDSQTPDPRIDVRIAWDGADALISVEDNGTGIPEEFVGSVFDIRFTPKDGGTGLGLNIAQEALARSGGSCSSTPSSSRVSDSRSGSRDTGGRRDDGEKPPLRRGQGG